MKKGNKLNKGITLIALIVTIIVLLILVGIVLAMVLGDNGIIAKAQMAKERTNASQQDDEDNISDYNDKMSAIIENRGIVAGSCTITISDKGVISVSGVENMKLFAIAKDDKYLDYTTESEYTLTMPAGERANIYVIAIDDDMKVYKSNIVDYESKITYLYNKGAEYCTIGGWADDSNWGKGSLSKNANNIYVMLNDFSSTGSSSAMITFSGLNSQGLDHLCIELKDMYCNSTGMSLSIRYNGNSSTYDYWNQTYNGTGTKTIDINLKDKNLSLTSFNIGWTCGSAQYFWASNWGTSNGATGNGYCSLVSAYLYK